MVSGMAQQQYMIAARGIGGSCRDGLGSPSIGITDMC